MNKKNAAGTVSFIFIAIMLSKVLGQVREMVIAAIYGTSTQASAYFMASQLPVSFFDMILGSAISSAFIPVYNMFMENDGKERANLFATRFLNVIILATAVISALGIAFAGPIMSVFGPSLDMSTKVLAAELLQIMFPMLIFTGMAFVFVGLLQSQGEFKIPAIMSIVSNAVCILYLFTLNKYFGIYGLAVSLVIGWVLQFIILAIPARKKGYRHSFKAGLADSGLKNVAALALPVLFASWVQPINATVNMSIASGFADGSGPSILNYANRLYIIAASVFAVSLTNYTFPKLSRLSIAKEGREWSDVVAGSIKLVLLIVIPIALVFLLQGEEIIRIIYQRGEFDETAVKLTSAAMFWYSIGMVWYSAQEIFNKAFYSVHDTKTPLIASVGSIITNVALSFILSKYMGISGLALAASVSAFVWCIFSGVMLKSRFFKESFKDLQLIKIIVMALAFALTVFFVRQFMCASVGVENLINRIITFAVPAIAGLAVYIILAFILKIKELDFIRNKLSKGGTVND